MDKGSAGNLFVVTKYSNLFSSFTFFLNSFHMAFCNECCDNTMITKLSKMLQSSNNIELFEFKRTFRKIGRSFLAFQDIPYNSKKNLHSCAGNCCQTDIKMISLKHQKIEGRYEL